MNAQLAICIPTRNRARYLRDCLAHLQTFRRLRLEVVVCDNASQDETRAAVESSPHDAFTRLAYHRHASDIGVTRNMDAALRMARAPYLWVLSDDDIPYESGLLYLVKYLDENPRAACIAGTYKSVGRMQAGVDAFVEPSAVQLIPRGNFDKLAANIMRTDAHPVMRREVFQRHCRIEERGFGLMPLYAQLLLEGEIAHISAAVFEHLTNPDSLSSRLGEAWALDHAVSDLEVAFGLAPRAIDAATLASAKTVLQTNVYHFAARIARQQGDALLMRHFLLRLKSLRAVDAECLVQWEFAFLHEAALQRLTQLLGDLGAKAVVLDDGAAAAGLGARLAASCPGIAIRDSAGGRVSASGPGDQAVRLAWESPVEAADAAPGDGCIATLSYSDILQTCRVTRYPITLTRRKPGDYGIAYNDADVAAMLQRRSRNFDQLMAAYSQEKGGDT